MTVLALVGGIVCTGDAVLPGHAVLVEGEPDRGRRPRRATSRRGAEVVELDGAFAAPGLVDLQVNGGGDVLLEDEPTAEGVAAIAAAHRALGTTALLPTLISPSNEAIAAAAAAVRAARDAGVPGVLGLHVEGPFLNPLHAGAHPPERLRPLTPDDADLLAGLGVPTLVTLAPEMVAPELLARLAAAGVHLAAGHSAADAAALDRAVGHGLRLVTHLFNAMSGFRARDPGLIGAALADDRVACGADRRRPARGRGGAAGRAPRQAARHALPRLRRDAAGRRARRDVPPRGGGGRRARRAPRAARWAARARSPAACGRSRRSASPCPRRSAWRARCPPTSSGWAARWAGCAPDAGRTSSWPARTAACCGVMAGGRLLSGTLRPRAPPTPSARP